MLKQLQLAIAFGVLLVSAGAHASPITIDTTYDLRNGLFSSSRLDDGSVAIANGDHVVLTVGFLNNLVLTLGDTIGDGSEYFSGWLAAGDNASSFTIDNSTIEFQGFSATGGAAAFYHIGMQSGGAAHLGPYLNDFLSAGQRVTFSGYQVTYDVKSIGRSPHDYGNLLFYANGNFVSIGLAHSVPEPATIYLTAIGLAALVGQSMRKATRSLFLRKNYSAPYLD